jgi:transcriptional regulator with XRE-family HTH domain
VTPQSFGGQLRKLREQQRVTLEMIEKKTKVSMSLLRSLENGGCEGWPGGIYSRGYVRAYAETIGVDPEHVLAAFVECYPAFAPGPTVEAVPEAEARPQTLVERVKAVVAGWFRYAAAAPGELEPTPYMEPGRWPMRASAASEPRARNEPAERRARARVGEFEGRSL